MEGGKRTRSLVSWYNKGSVDRMVTHNQLERAKSDGRNYQCKKEAGMTSHDVVFKLRKILGTKKIGHGERWIQMWWECFRLQLERRPGWSNSCKMKAKVYEGEITLGFSTTTEDASGEVVRADPSGSIL